MSELVDLRLFTMRDLARMAAGSEPAIIARQDHPMRRAGEASFGQ